MQSENFDNKIKDSLSQRPPGNEPPEWSKMETLLDQHLPVEKKDRRRIVFVLFLFLLLGGGAFFIWNNNNNTKDEITTAKPDTGNSIPGNGIDATGNPTDNTTTKTESTIKESVKNNSEVPPGQTQNQVTSTTGKTKDPVIRKNNQPNNRTITPIRVNERPTRKDVANIQPGKQTEKTNTNTQRLTSVEKNKDQQNAPAAVPKQDTDPSQKNTDIQKPVEAKPAEPGKTSEEQKPVKAEESQPKLNANTKSQKQDNRNSFLDNLFFSVSAGPDFSTVGLDDGGKIRPVVGVGVGYQLSGKFSVRTGFYSARKVYTADPYDYHPPYNVWAYYPNLKNIDANCKVYEIPVNVDYTISENKKQGWFVSAGLSSFLMKEETYDYHYKPNSSPTYITYRKTIRDENQHYFSVLNLSGGYTRYVNKNFSLRAEPYAKFALGGVGYGKVKLNGGGVLVSAIIKPFARK